MASSAQTEATRSSSAGDALEIDLSVLQGLWSEEQYLRLTNGANHLVEFTDGVLEVLPVPTRNHQAILGLLYLAFLGALQPRGGAVYFMGLPLRIRPGKYREPDLLALLDARDPRNQNAFWLGADLVVEVVSPNNPARDTQVKRGDYAEAGIPEYWIVNPLDDTITVLRLAGGEYVEHGVFRRGERATSALLPDFTVPVSDVLDAE